MSKPDIQKVKTVDERTLPVFDEVDRLMQHIRERAFERCAGRGFGDGHDLEDWLEAEREICWPAAEFAEDEDEFTVKLALAGYEPEEISVTANPRELIIKANHEEKKEEHEESAEAKVRWSEFRSNNVCRRIEMPASVDVDRISAKFKYGMLTIEAPKAAKKAERPRKVKISSAA